MNTFESINGRRSIRKFKDQIVPCELIKKIIIAAHKAPSGMNRQPWKFVVLQGEKKADLIQILQKRTNFLKKMPIKTEGYEHTVKSLEQAPVMILVFNTGFQPKPIFLPFYRYLRLLDIQSIGGAIQTLLLAAQDLGLGTLWIGNIFYADKQIRRFFNTKAELIAAVAVGYPDEAPDSRPRKNLDDIVEWFK